MISLGSSVTLYNYWRVALHRQNYAPATFKIEKLEFHNRNQWLCTADGTIGGVLESTCLNDFHPEAKGKADLKRLAPIGSHLQVWYDPTAPDVATQGRYLRVLPEGIYTAYTVPNALWHTLILDGATTVFGLMLFLTTRRNRFRTHPEATQTPPQPKKNKNLHQRTTDHEQIT